MYTGFAAVDYLVAMPVGFWTPAITQYPALKLQSVVLYPALQSLAAWASVEGFRGSGNKPLMLRLAPLYLCGCGLALVFLWACSAITIYCFTFIPPEQVTTYLVSLTTTPCHSHSPRLWPTFSHTFLLTSHLLE